MLRTIKELLYEFLIIPFEFGKEFILYIIEDEKRTRQDVEAAEKILKQKGR